MKKSLYLFLIIILNSGITLYAQEWTVQDSIWLQRILEGNEKIRLNEQTLKAIESGTLIRDPSLLPKEFKTHPLEMPIIRSFEDIKSSESPQPIQPLDLPVAVYHIYVLQQPVNLSTGSNIPQHPVKQPTVSNGSLTFNVKKHTFLDLKIPDALNLGDPPPLRLPDGSVSGGGNGGASVSANFEDMLRTLFWPSHRAKKRNAQNANAWKNYNEHK